MEWILLLLLLGLLVWAITTFNGLVRLRNQVNEAWAGIDVQLQLRYELVPNLLATVKGYMQHESSVLERVTRLRGDPSMPLEKRAGEESGLSRSLGKLFALAEAYPELKASEGFQQLHQSLVNIEDQLQFARRYYNGSVRDNNNRVESFPSLLVARLFGFKLAEFFEIELASQRQAPEVQMGQAG
ncbi:MAG TPA: LemA family protein [Xanthomonadales bacterium]|nr:LemA family protein [Xanthomonadales bacterium]